jgi:mRNA-degrading endonuclease RelE of RelBE toxin-antitoxin system
MVEIRFSKEFVKKFSKMKDVVFKKKIVSQINKIEVNPEVGKPMRNVRRGTGELYVKPFRLSYQYDKSGDVVLIRDLYHKKFQ